MRTTIVDGRTIAYRDVGEGPAVILAHCSSASHREWVHLIDQLTGRYRVLAPDLLGYGRSEPWRDGEPLDPRLEPAVLIRLAELAGGPVYLAGHSYGAAVALEAARRMPGRVRGMTLVEPVSFYLLRHAGRPEWAEVERLAQRVAGELAAGRRERAAACYMGYWVGRVRWWLMPRKARASIVKTVGKVAAEFAMIEAMPWVPAEYAAIGAPAQLVMGARTTPAAKAVIEVLAGVLPRVKVRVVRGAGHMSPVTHREEVAGLIARHIDECRIAASLGEVATAERT